MACQWCRPQAYQWCPPRACQWWPPQASQWWPPQASQWWPPQASQVERLLRVAGAGAGSRSCLDSASDSSFSPSFSSRCPVTAAGYKLQWRDEYKFGVERCATGHGHHCKETSSSSNGYPAYERTLTNTAGKSIKEQNLFPFQLLPAIIHANQNPFPKDQLWLLALRWILSLDHRLQDWIQHIFLTSQRSGIDGLNWILHFYAVQTLPLGDVIVMAAIRVSNIIPIYHWSKYQLRQELFLSRYVPLIPDFSQHRLCHC